MRLGINHALLRLRRAWRQPHPKDVESITAQQQPYCCDIYHFLQFLFLRDVTACAATSVIAVVATAPRTTRQRLMMSISEFPLTAAKTE
jgi:hypothetical protein